MSKIEIVRAAMVTAMKNKDKARKDSLSMLLSALKNAEIDKRSPLTEEEENAVVKKEIKQAKETMDTAPESRQDIREEARARMEVYKEFAPGSDQGGHRRRSGRTCHRGPDARRQGKDHEGSDAESEGKGRRKNGKRDPGRHV